MTHNETLSLNLSDTVYTLIQIPNSDPVTQQICAFGRDSGPIIISSPTPVYHYVKQKLKNQRVCVTIK